MPKRRLRSSCLTASSRSCCSPSIGGPASKPDASPLVTCCVGIPAPFSAGQFLANASMNLFGRQIQVPLPCRPGPPESSSRER